MQQCDAHKRVIRPACGVAESPQGAHTHEQALLFYWTARRIPREISPPAARNGGRAAPGEGYDADALRISRHPPAARFEVEARSRRAFRPRPRDDAWRPTRGREVQPGFHQGGNGYGTQDGGLTASRRADVAARSEETRGQAIDRRSAAKRPSEDASSIYGDIRETEQAWQDCSLVDTLLRVSRRPALMLPPGCWSRCRGGGIDLPCTEPNEPKRKKIGKRPDEPGSQPARLPESPPGRAHRAGVSDLLGERRARTDFRRCTPVARFRDPGA
jgi:hypothetical protein